jgi:hypothetical protein
MSKHYRTFLQQVHETIKPKLYLEIGVRDGSSFTLSKCLSFGVDPAFVINKEIRNDCRLYRLSSDDFFEQINFKTESRGLPLDFAFIDGMHLSEYAFRDFVNVLKLSTPDTIIIFDDIIPQVMEVTCRTQLKGAWTGDVYKVIPALREYMPSLGITTVDTTPSGLAIIYNLDPTDTTLLDASKEIQQRLLSDDYTIATLGALRSSFSPVSPNEGVKLIRDLRNKAARRKKHSSGFLASTTLWRRWIS